MRRLTWGGLGNSTAQWQPQWVCLFRGNLYFLPSEDATDSEAICQNAWLGRRAAALAPEMAAGIQHCVAIVKQGADVSKATQESSSSVLRFGTADEVRRFYSECGNLRVEAPLLRLVAYETKTSIRYKGGLAKVHCSLMGS